MNQVNINFRKIGVLSDQDLLNQIKVEDIPVVEIQVKKFEILSDKDEILNLDSEKSFNDINKQVNDKYGRDGKDMEVIIKEATKWKDKFKYEIRFYLENKQDPAKKTEEVKPDVLPDFMKGDQEDEKNPAAPVEAKEGEVKNEINDFAEQIADPKVDEDEK